MKRMVFRAASVMVSVLAPGLIGVPAANALQAANGGGGSTSACYGTPTWWSVPCTTGTMSGGWSGSPQGADMIGRNLVRNVHMSTPDGTVGYYSWRVDPVEGAGANGQTLYHTVMYGWVYQDRVPGVPSVRELDGK